MVKVTGQVLVVGTFEYEGHTLVAAHGAPYKWGNKVTNIAVILSHFGFITNEALALAYGGNSASNMLRWFTAASGNVSNASQRAKPFDTVAFADAATLAKIGVTDKGGALVLAKSAPIAWLPKAAESGALPLLTAAYEAMVRTIKASKGQLVAARKGNDVVVQVADKVVQNRTQPPARTKRSPKPEPEAEEVKPTTQTPSDASTIVQRMIAEQTGVKAAQ